jgi:excisionase family DNA binding protein
VISPDQDPSDDPLLKPREAAQMLGVRTATLARWAREGRLTPLRTPGAHRRYLRSQIRRVLAQVREPGEAERRLTEDAVRLYQQGWSIRQVAEKFDLGYGVMRRILRPHTTLRSRGGARPAPGG